jgi:hypothetical protein
MLLAVLHHGKLLWLMGLRLLWPGELLRRLHDGLRNMR